MWYASRMAFPKKVKTEALRLVRSGVPHREIARRLKVSPSAVRVWAREAGIAPAPQPDQHPPAPAEPTPAKPRRKARSAKAEPSAPAEDSSDPLQGAPLELPDPAPGWTPPEPVEVAPAEGTPAELLRELLGQQRRQIAEARREGNSQLVGKLMRDLKDTSKDLATAEKDAAKTAAAGGDIVISRAKIDEGLREITENIAKLAAIPNVCEHCGRAMRIRAASSGEADA